MTGGRLPQARGAEELDRERAVLQAIIDSTSANLAYLDPQFNFLRVNAAYAQGSGYSPEELIGRNHFDLFPHMGNESAFRRVRDTGEPVTFQAKAFDFPNQPERGTTYWDWSLVPVKDDEGQVCGLVLSAMDVTQQVRSRQERKQLQEQLKRHAERLEEVVARRTAALRVSEARFRTIFEDSVLGIALLGARGRIVAANPALQAMLGYSAEELCAMTLTDCSHPDDVEENQDLYRTLSSGELDYYQDEQRYVRKGGQVRWGQLTVSRIKRAEARGSRLAIAMVADITEEKASQEALLRSERLALAGRLGASLAHEINNPLQSVIGCLGLAEEMLDDGVEVRRFLEIAMEELERAAGIVTQLRDLGRESEARKEPADLGLLMDKTLLLTRKRCEAGGVEVTWSPADGLTPVPVVPERMQQVFLNMVLNAVEAMPGGGRLNVSIGPTDQPEGVQIRFADTGEGIEPGALPQIFEPFHSTRPDGLGLGLYVSRQIVEEHGGHIDVRSREGEGATFTVWLPR